MYLPWRPTGPAADGGTISSSVTAAEAAALRQLAANREHVLEVGAAFGFSTILLAQEAGHVTSVDPHTAFESLPALAANLEHYGVSERVTVLAELSQRALQRLPQAFFDMAFVDGDHTFEGVRHDALEVLRLVRSGGILAFHDYHEGTCPDVARVLDHLFPGGPARIVDTLFVVPRP